MSNQGRVDNYDSLAKSCSEQIHTIRQLQSRLDIAVKALERLATPESLAGISRPATEEEKARMFCAQDALKQLRGE